MRSLRHKKNYVSGLKAKLFTEIGRSKYQQTQIASSLLYLHQRDTLTLCLSLCDQKRFRRKKGNHSAIFEVLTVGTETTEVVATTFQILTAQKKKADLTRKANRNKENCQDKGKTVVHRLV